MPTKHRFPLTPTASAPRTRTRSSKADQRELLRRWIAGDRRAGDRLFACYYPQLLRYFGRAVSAQEQAELTQETLMQLCVSAKSAVEATNGVRSYVFGIARNVLNLHLRRSYSRRKLDEQLARGVEPEGPVPSLAVDTVRQRAQLLEQLEQLPAETRSLLQAYYWEGRTAAALGEELGIPPCTVRTRLYHCKRRLREALEQGGVELGGDFEQQVARVRGLLCLGPSALA